MSSTNSDRTRGRTGIRPAKLASLKQSSGIPTPARGSAIGAFRSTGWRYWKKNGRHDLPWRKTRDPYRILVSELMLQQTQVPRVVEKYEQFLKRFPNVRTLARALLADVLKVWSGLGYNRRGKYLRDAAKIIVEKHGGKIPDGYPALRALPGVGDYTARAIRVFAFNKSDTLIETNIRAVFIHHFFSDIPSVSDRQIMEYAEKAAKGQNPREWHWALMDYGAHLKRSGVRTNNRSAHYAKQSKFEGSLRQLRGAILRELTKTGRLNLPDSPQVRHALAGLARDGLTVRQKGGWRIA